MGGISKKQAAAERARKLTEAREAKKKDKNLEQIKTSQETHAKPKKTYSNEHIFVEIGALQLLMGGIICGVCRKTHVYSCPCITLFLPLSGVRIKHIR